MKKIDFKKILAKIRLKPHLEYKSISSKVSHDWKKIIITFFLFWILIVAGSFYILVEINKGDIFTVSVESEKQNAIVDEDLLEKTFNYFVSRKNDLEKMQFGSFRSGMLEKGDPSL